MTENNTLLIPIFPEATLYVSKLTIKNNKINNLIKNTKFIITKGNYNCYVSNKYNVLDDLHEIKKQCTTQIKKYLTDVLKYKMDFKFLNSWITKTEPDGYGYTHMHTNSFFSGVFYPKGDKNYFINFYRDRRDIYDVDKHEDNQFNCSRYKLNIEEDNILILFPSHLKHSIEKNTSKNNRYSIAFNINPKGSIGVADSKIYFE